MADRSFRTHGSLFALICVAAVSLNMIGCGESDKQTPESGYTQDESMLVSTSAESAATTTNAPASESRPAAPDDVAVSDAILAAFAPLPDVMESKDNPITEEKVALGRMLYYEPRLSKSQTISCNSCHQLDKFGVDNEPTSPGHRGQRGDRNSPTTYNAALHIAQFWDGRAPTVEEQAKGPVLNAVEMAMPDEKHVLTVLNSIPQYVQRFKDAFPESSDNPVTYDNMAKAIGAFERKLVTPSRWDKFLKGDKAALTAAEKQGFNDFVAAGCIQCHLGPGVGGGMYQKLGLVLPWPNLKDEGRSKITGNEAEKHFFKVPSLRNIEKTGPYFHDGSVATLEEAVRLMSKHQTAGGELPAEKIASIVTFLKALTGELPRDFIKKPDLPEGTEATPRPDES